MLLNHFDVLISKIILKNKKNYFNAFSREKYFEKQQQSHFQTPGKSWASDQIDLLSYHWVLNPKKEYKYHV